MFGKYSNDFALIFDRFLVGVLIAMIFAVNSTFHDLPICRAAGGAPRDILGTFDDCWLIFD